MKKIYVKPTIEVELTETDNLMTASGNASYDLGNGNGADNRVDEGIDEWDGGESLSKGGSFTCWEDEGDWAL